MLLGSFKEATNPIIEMDFDGPILQAIVEFIYIERATLFDKPCFRDLVPTVVAVIGASNFLAIPELGDLAEQFAAASLDNDSGLAGPFLAACEPYGEAAINVEELAMQVIRFDPQVLLDKHSLQLLSSQQLEKVLKDKEFFTDEMTLFMIIQLWSTSFIENLYEVENLASLEDELDPASRRQKEAIELIEKHIHLDRIDPETLVATVEPSRLVSNRKISDAFKKQALSAHKQCGNSWLNSRKPSFPIWKCEPNSVLYCRDNDRELHMLRCKKLMKSGTFTWKIAVEKEQSVFWLGIAYTFGIFSKEPSKRWLYGSNGSLYFQDGGTKQKLGEQLPEFSSGTTLTFVLDLTDDEGFLSVSSDGFESRQLVRNVRSHLNSKDFGGFLPFAYLTTGAKIRLLSFDDNNPTPAQGLFGSTSS